MREIPRNAKQTVRDGHYVGSYRLLEKCSWCGQQTIDVLAGHGAVTLCEACDSVHLMPGQVIR